MKSSALNPLKLGVVGDPIEHSLSPQIHQQFARQLNVAVDYRRYHKTQAELEVFFEAFFNSGEGHGLNVTLPHKLAAALWADELSDEADFTGSVNTLVKTESGVKGYSTDGDGLLMDLNRLNIAVKEQPVLLLGAGGAAKSVLYALLKAGAQVCLFNRTVQKAELLADLYADIGEVKLWTVECRPSLIISSLSDFDNPVIEVLQRVLHPQCRVYDLNYGHRSQALRQRIAAIQPEAGFYDGRGMLMAQAALSFNLWSGQMPDWQAIEWPG